MRRVFFWLTIASTAGAAYLMFKRGASLGEIASKAMTNPIGTLASELKTL